MPPLEFAVLLPLIDAAQASQGPGVSAGNAGTAAQLAGLAIVVALLALIVRLARR
jgi:hypothetical protein